MTRWLRGHKASTKRRILETAGRLFRQRGYASTGVSEVMEGAELTVGGFYAHFESKEGLLSEVLSTAFEQTRSVLLLGLERITGPAFVREVTRRYLSRMHRDLHDSGCVLPALAAEVGRSGAAPREEIERYLIAVVDLLAEKTPALPESRLSAKERALALTALSVGGILLARAVKDEKLSDTILRACRRLAVAPEESSVES
jgi:TetR/AcrR family transcriptional regulator, transcriptional repressor for nem operon